MTLTDYNHKWSGFVAMCYLNPPHKLARPLLNRRQSLSFTQICTSHSLGGGQTVVAP